MTDQPEEVTEPVTEVTDLVEVTEPVEVTDPIEVTPEVEATEPVKVTSLTAIEFIRQAQEPGLAHDIDKLTKEIKTQTGASYRQILRGYALVLRAIGTALPWNEEDGLDARRFHTHSKVSLPPLRECIGACLGLQFLRPEPDASEDSPDPEVSPPSDGDEAPDVATEE